MTMQAREIVEYRGEQYSLYANPLHSYLETRRDISFEMYTTAHWRGYQGIWKLDQDKFFLKSISSANHTIQTIFQKSEPILAEWFSGTIEIGIGEPVHTDWDIIYDNYLWLKLDKGIVVEKKIVKPIEDNLDIHFGKYKGQTILDVLKGKINDSFNNSSLYKEYILEVLNFFNGEYNKKINAPYFNITDEIRAVVNNIKNTTIRSLVTSNFIAIEKHFYINSVGEEETEKFSKLLEEILSSDFSTIRTLSKKEYPEADIAENTFLINGDWRYLNWAIKTVDNFCVPPHIIAKKTTQKFLNRFEIKRLNSTIFEYKPIITDVAINFNEEIKKINLTKFKKTFGVLYDEKNDIYGHNLDENTLYKKFGYFLDERYEQEPVPDKNNFNRTEYDYDNHYERESYGAYAGTYAQDVEGLSDDFIDDVLDGDPDAYWNID